MKVTKEGEKYVHTDSGGVWLMTGKCEIGGSRWWWWLMMKSGDLRWNNLKKSRKIEAISKTHYKERNNNLNNKHMHVVVVVPHHRSPAYAKY